VDYLLEAAAAQLRGMTEGDWPGARQSSEITYVAKLHGSCNFTTPVDPWTRVLLSTGNTHVETRIDASDPFAALTESVAEGIFPIMTQIAPSRDDFLASAQIFQIRQIWGQAIRNASLIVVIGVAPRKYDRHVWDPLHDARGDIVYIGGNSDANDWRECNPRFRSLGTSCFGHGFRPLLRCLATHKRKSGGSLSNYLLDTWRAWLY
jgi:hypothetical protein